MNKKQVLIDYLKLKVEEQDWHGVSDAANDIRVLEVHESQLNMQFKPLEVEFNQPILTVSDDKGFTFGGPVNITKFYAPKEIKIKGVKPTGKRKRCIDHSKPHIKLNPKIANTIRKLWATGDWTQPRLATEYGVKQQTISDIIKGKIYAKDMQRLPPQQA